MRRGYGEGFVVIILENDGAFMRSWSGRPAFMRHVLLIGSVLFGSKEHKGNDRGREGKSKHTVVRR